MGVRQKQHGRTQKTHDSFSSGRSRVKRGWGERKDRKKVVLLTAASGGP